MWEIRYSQEVRNYIYDSYPFTETVWKAIKSLRNIQDGIPSTKVQQLEPELYLWEVANHLVLYRRIEAERTLRFIIVKPLD
jgi:hypothetical protein